MENEKDQVQEDNTEEKKFLKISKIRSFSNAFNLKLKENDIIVAVNGEIFNSTYEDLRKILEEDNDKIITIFRDGITFNIRPNGSLGITCEQESEDKILDFKNIKINEIFNNKKKFFNFEIYKNLKRKGIVLDLTPSILPSLAPPLWMIYQRMWPLLGFTLIFQFILFYVSPWLFFISWVLKSWYYGYNQINILRNYYRFLDYRLWLCLSSENEEESQKKSRELDPKIVFDFSYVGPPALDDDETTDQDQVVKA
tara:strand:- start:1443 stop:2204 length:762 start_codon:yes stop_codon:yes gene_type:complete